MAKYFRSDFELEPKIEGGSGKTTQYIAVNEEDARHFHGNVGVPGRVATIIVEHENYLPAQNDNRTGQLPLFDYAPASIGNLASDPSMRHTVPTLLAMATEGKGEVTHDDALTKYSSNLIGRLRGSLPISSPSTNPTAEETDYGHNRNNPITAEFSHIAIGDEEGFFADGYWVYPDSLFNPVDDSTVKRAQTRGRQIVRGLSGRTSTHLSSQFTPVKGFTDVQIPGLEG